MTSIAKRGLTKIGHVDLSVVFNSFMQPSGATIAIFWQYPPDPSFGIPIVEDALDSFTLNLLPVAEVGKQVEK
jgi:hypothetical protein